MSTRHFKLSIAGVGLAFTLFFCVTVVPPLVASSDVLGAFAAGFVNPFAARYSTDVIACWLILAIWVMFEAKTRKIKNGWVCLLVGVVPGVAVGFAAYLTIRLSQLENADS